MVDENTPQTNDFEEKLACEKKRSEDYLKRLQYMQADFENVKKRFDREIEQTRNSCNERMIMALLEVVDELELALKNGEISTSQTESLLEGVEMTLKKLRKVLEQESVTEIENPEGKAFDPSKHHAVATEESDALDGTVLEQIRKGYTLKGKVIRPAIVKVAIKKQQNQSNQTEEKVNE